MEAKEVIELAENNGDMDLLFEFTMIVANSDSIGEGWGYVSGGYTREMFDREIESLKKGKSIGWSEYVEYAGVDIYMTHLSALNK